MPVEMDGFDSKFVSPPDYILGVTKEIWEDRGIHTLRDYYARTIPVRSPAGLVVGNEAVIAATLATLAEFPDRQLFGEDVIWSADPAGGFLSSHRIVSTATHSGEGAYGAPSGARLRYRIIADCAARQNQIYDEWLVRDQGAIVRQMGVEPKRYAADQIEAEGGPELAKRPFGPDLDVPGAYVATGNDHHAGIRYRDTLDRIMAGELAAVSSNYDRALHAEYPGGRTEHGAGAADAFWLQLRAAFPTATFTVHHQIGRDDAGLPERAAVRWSLDGSHSGWGAFGVPTGAPVHVMGINHVEFGPGGIRREYVLYDETAIWKQILLHSG